MNDISQVEKDLGYVRGVVEGADERRAPVAVYLLWAAIVLVGFALVDGNNTFPFTFPKNVDNDLVEKGIENLFPKQLFKDFIKRVSFSNGTTLEEFDTTRKKDFEAFVLGRNELADFALFRVFIDKVRSLCEEQ